MRLLNVEIVMEIYIVNHVSTKVIKEIFLNFLQFFFNFQLSYLGHFGTHSDYEMKRHKFEVYNRRVI